MDPVLKQATWCTNERCHLQPLWRPPKKNGLKPYEYISHLLGQIPNVDPGDPAALDAFLPWSETLPAACRSLRNNQ
ncbi:MAG: transposase domain-containing protein [Limnochordia bacterium]